MPSVSVRVKDIETLNERARGLRYIAEIAKFLVGAESIVDLSPSMVYGFWHSDPGARTNDLQFIFTPASFKLGVHGLLDDQPNAHRGRQMHRDVAPVHHLGDQRRIGNRADSIRELVSIDQAIHIGHRSRREIVESQHAMARVHQAFSQVRTDETHPAGDKDLHFSP